MCKRLHIACNRASKYNDQDKGEYDTIYEGNVWKRWNIISVMMVYMTNYLHHETFNTLVLTWKSHGTNNGIVGDLRRSDAQFRWHDAHLTYWHSSPVATYFLMIDYYMAI